MKKIYLDLESIPYKIRLALSSFCLKSWIGLERLEKTVATENAVRIVEEVTSILSGVYGNPSTVVETPEKTKMKWGDREVDVCSRVDSYHPGETIISLYYK